MFHFVILKVFKRLPKQSLFIRSQNSLSIILKAEFRRVRQKFIGSIPTSLNRSFPQSLSKYKSLDSSFLRALAGRCINCVKKALLLVTEKQESGSS